MAKKEPHPRALDAGDLQYHVEIWDARNTRAERVAGAAIYSNFARAMMDDVAKEFPKNWIILRTGSRVIAESAPREQN